MSLLSIVTCPACGGDMEALLVTCWDCYREHKGRFGYPDWAPASVARWERDREARIA